MHSYPAPETERVMSRLSVEIKAKSITPVDPDDPVDPIPDDPVDPTPDEGRIVVPDTGAFTSVNAKENNHNNNVSPVTIVSGILIVAVIAFAIVNFITHRKNSFSSSFTIKRNKGTLINAFALVAVLMTLSIVGVNANKNQDSSFALTGTGDRLSIIVQDTELSLEVEDTPVFGAASSVVTVNTASETGYTLSAYANNYGDLTAASITDKIGMKSTTKAGALSSNTWGIALSRPVDQTSEVFHGLSTSSSDPLAIKTVETATTAGDSTTIYYGVYVEPTLKKATYTGEVNFIAVANVIEPDPEPDPDDPEPQPDDKIYMWDANPNDCGKTMWDNRDGEERHYATEAVGETCWMTEQIEIVGGTPLYSDTSNVPEGYNSADENPYYTLPPSSEEGFTDDDAPYIYNSGSTTCGEESPCYNYYSYVAATAGTNPSTGNAEYDICPKGWRLPTLAEYEELVSSYPESTSFTEEPFAGILGGYFADSTLHNGNQNGFYWTSTALSETNAHYLYFDSEDATVSTELGKATGGFIRCVLKESVTPDPGPGPGPDPEPTQHTCYKRWKLENADGSMQEDYYEEESEMIEDGGTCTFSKTIQDYNNDQEKSETVSNITEDTWIILNFYRNQYQLTVEKNSEYIEDAAIVEDEDRQTNINARWGQIVDINAISKSGSVFAGWTQTAGTAGSFGNASLATTTFTMPKSAATIYADGEEATTTQFTCFKQYRLQKDDGTYPTEYTEDGSVQVETGETCSYTKSVEYYETQTTSETVNSNITLSLDLPRTTYTLTVERNTSYIDSVTGSGTYRWGQAVSISATPSSTSVFTNWSQTNGENGTFGNTSSATTTFTMPKSAATIYANGEAAPVAQFTCSKQYRLQKADGTYPSDYTQDGSIQVEAGNTCSYTKSVEYYETQTTSETVNSNITLSLDLPRTTYTLTVNRNASFIESVTGSGTYRWGQSVPISATPYSTSVFTGWTQTNNEEDGVFADAYASSTTFTMPRSVVVVYANGVDYFPSNCATEETCMQTSNACDTTLTDGRDGTTYTVATINGGCWMTQNLRINNYIKAAYSNFVGEDFNVCAGDLASGNSRTEARCHFGEDNHGGPTAWYNFPAASAGTVTDNTGVAESPYDICPRGWKLPSDLDMSTILGHEAEFQAVGGGAWDDGVLKDLDYGYWWSSSVSDSGPSSFAQTLSYDSRPLDDSGIDVNDRGTGRYVRCIRKTS